MKFKANSVTPLLVPQSHPELTTLAWKEISTSSTNESANYAAFNTRGNKEVPYFFPSKYIKAINRDLLVWLEDWEAY